MYLQSNTKECFSLALCFRFLYLIAGTRTSTRNPFSCSFLVPSNHKSTNAVHSNKKILLFVRVVLLIFRFSFFDFLLPLRTFWFENCCTHLFVSTLDRNHCRCTGFVGPQLSFVNKISSLLSSVNCERKKIAGSECELFKSQIAIPSFARFIHDEIATHNNISFYFYCTLILPIYSNISFSFIYPPPSLIKNSNQNTANETLCTHIHGNGRKPTKYVFSLHQLSSAGRSFWFASHTR